MIHEQHIMRRWVNALRQWGIDHWMAAFLENGGPFNLFIAQILIMAQPFISGLLPEAKWNVLTQILTDPIQAKAFINLLREQGT
jgi:hypothetical protein